MAPIKQRLSTVSLNKIVEDRYAFTLSYPKFNNKYLNTLLTDMKKLGVKALCFTGQKYVNNTQVLGKGQVGIVVLAETERGKAALKIKRTDSNRTGMKGEAEMIRLANSVGVGPKLLGYTKNLLMMEYIDGFLISQWFKKLEEINKAPLVLRKVLTEVLEQCWRLDYLGLDHGELSNASKHIMVNLEDKVFILDFESSSTSRRVSNTTSVCHYFFIGGKGSKETESYLNLTKKNHVILSLREYKKQPTRLNFETILKSCLP